MAYDPFDIEAADKALDASSEARKQQANQELDDIEWLMNQEAGRRIVYRLLSQAGVFHTTFNTNALTMANNEGKRSQGLRLLALIQSRCGHLYEPMMKEARSNDRSNGN